MIIVLLNVNNIIWNFLKFRKKAHVLYCHKYNQLVIFVQKIEKKNVHEGTVDLTG